MSSIGSAGIFNSGGNSGNCRQCQQLDIGECARHRRDPLARRWCVPSATPARNRSAIASIDCRRHRARPGRFRQRMIASRNSAKYDRGERTGADGRSRVDRSDVKPGGRQAPRLPQPRSRHSPSYEVDRSDEPARRPRRTLVRAVAIPSSTPAMSRASGPIVSNDGASGHTPSREMRAG